MKIHALFPTAVIQSSLDRCLTNEESDFFSKDIEFVKAVGNFTSRDKHILDDPKLFSLKKDLTKKLQEYIDTIYKPVNRVEAYITQSWISVTPPGGHHHTHKHPNSFLSGVFYLDVDEKLDKINFISDEYTTVYVESKEWDDYNSFHWCINVHPYSVVVFPSSLSHNVPDTSNPNNRVSLAFNSFISGEMGCEEDLTYLKL